MKVRVKQGFIKAGFLFKAGEILAWEKPFIIVHRDFGIRLTDKEYKKLIESNKEMNKYTK